MDLINASWTSQAIAVAARFRIADLLAQGASTADALAANIGCHAPSLRRLLRALASLDICSELEDGSFELRPMGSLLCENAHPSLRAWAIWWGQYLWPVWGHLAHSVTTGAPARDLVTGRPGFEPLEANPPMADAFNRAMVELTRLTAATIVESCDLSRCHRIADIGGGYGEFLATALAAHPGMRGILMDLPHAVQGAHRHLKSAGVHHRCEIVAGNFFEAVPAGADVYVLKSIIHDWDDARASVIFRNCRRAMTPDARLLIIEHLMPTRMRPGAASQGLARADLNMLLAHGAKERTPEEFRSLLEPQGLLLHRIAPTRTSLAIIEAVPS
jgi:hypothetical protein